MQSISSSSMLADLFEEYSDWYHTLAEENGVLPRSVSGVSAEGQQFIYLIDGLELHHMARNKYVRFVLDEHRSVAYAYGGLALRGDSDQGEIEEVLDVVAADSTHYIMGHWRVSRGADGMIIALQHMGTSEGDDPEKHPSAWFLAGSIRFADPEKLKFRGIWEQDRPGIIFNDRHGADDDDRPA
ncbi:MAG: hypothetical protein HGB00_06980 [Chlorobiaceae bacterium]|nr:hypothetical protein [Chlorobiaceae bacterium]